MANYSCKKLHPFQTDWRTRTDGR